MEIRPRKGLLSGALAFVATYIIVFALLLFFPLGSFLSGLGFEVYHALFYDAHNPLATLGLVGSNLFALTSITYALVVMLVPPIILLSQAHELADGDAELPVALQQSVSVAAGYTPLALAGTVFVSEFIGGADVLLTAIVYPVVFGLFGGVIAVSR